jgi:hypothetical protein
MFRVPTFVQLAIISFAVCLPATAHVSGRSRAVPLKSVIRSASTIVIVDTTSMKHSQKTISVRYRKVKGAKPLTTKPLEFSYRLSAVKVLETIRMAPRTDLPVRSRPANKTAGRTNKRRKLKRGDTVRYVASTVRRSLDYRYNEHFKGMRRRYYYDGNKIVDKAATGKRAILLLSKYSTRVHGFVSALNDGTIPISYLGLVRRTIK